MANQNQIFTTNKVLLGCAFLEVAEYSFLGGPVETRFPVVFSLPRMVQGGETRHGL